MRLAGEARSAKTGTAVQRPYGRGGRGRDRAGQTLTIAAALVIELNRHESCPLAWGGCGSFFAVGVDAGVGASVEDGVSAGAPAGLVGKT